MNFRGIRSIQVFRIFLAEPTREQYGFSLMRSTGIRSGALYPLLARLERAGWLRSHLEDINKQTEGRPPRRLYQLTPTGRREIRRELIEFYDRLGPVPDGLLEER
jgi:PadR family transcriptional regulator